MLELQAGEIEKVVRLASRPDEREGFKNWFADVLTRVAGGYEAAEVDAKKRLFGNYVGAELDAVAAERGEFEFLVKAIVESAASGKGGAVRNLVALLLGRYWERVFCREFTFATNHSGYIYRFQKHQNLGMARLAQGTDMVGRKQVRAPDVLFIYQQQWVMGDIKHVTANEAGCYYMSEKDYEADVLLANMKPNIPLWFIVHDHGGLKWTTENNTDAWQIGELRELGEPTRRSFTPSSVHFRASSTEVGCCWPKGKFSSLEDMTDKLCNNAA